MQGTLRVHGDSDDGNHDGDTSALIFKVQSDRSERVYFRGFSYGDYTGRSWTLAPTYGALLDDMYSYQYLSGIAMNQAGYKPANIRIENHTSFYFLPYHMAQGTTYDYLIQTDDTASKGPMPDVFSLAYYAYQGTGQELIGKLGAYSDEELNYRAHVYKNYLTVDEKTEAFMLEIIDQENFSRSDADIIQRVAQYIKNSATYSKEKNELLDQEDNVVIAFLSEYREGVCRHYAATATLLFRTLGIPARYTEGYVATTVAGEWVEVRTPGHAWTEIYVDGVGWIPIEVTPSSNENGNTTETPKPKLTIRPEYQYKTHDGTPLYAKDEIVVNEDLAELLNEGYTYEVVISGSQTNIGKSASTVTEFYLYDADNQDVTEQYNIVYEPGVLEVFKPDTKMIRVYLHELQKYYDGTALYFTQSDYDVSGLQSGHRLELDLNISLTDAGSIYLHEIQDDPTQYATYRVYSGTTDVTDQYTLIFEAPQNASAYYCPIRVDKRILELTANSVTKDDDGTPLLPQGAVISKGGLATGHVLQPVIVEGSQTGIGSSSCYVDSYSVIIFDAFGKNVTDNYLISLKSGKLEICDPYS